MSIPTIRMKTRLPPSTRAPPTAARGWRYRLLASTGASGSDASGIIASSGGSTSATRALLGRVILTTFHRAVPRHDLAWCPGGCRCAHVSGRAPVPHRALRCDRGRNGVRRRGHGRGGVRREDLHLVPLRLDGRYRPVLVGEERNEEDGSEDDDRPVGREEPPSSPPERLWWGDDDVITRLDRIKLCGMFRRHGLFREIAVHHRRVELLHVHEVGVPDEDRENGENGLCTVGRLCRRDELAREDARRRDRIPHHEARHCHEDRAPDDRPVLELLRERESPLIGRLAAEPEVCLLYTSPSPRDGLLSRMP